jgi:hypothetical protein
VQCSSACPGSLWPSSATLQSYASDGTPGIYSIESTAAAAAAAAATAAAAAAAALPIELIESGSFDLLRRALP